MMFSTTSLSWSEEDISQTPITEEKAKQIALEACDYLSTNNPSTLAFEQLETSWKGLPKTAATIEIQTKDYFIATVHNKAENKTLYLLISTAGDVYDVNFTGDFSKVDS
jgi:hypothetical protein